jgi:hypothetical protein
LRISALRRNVRRIAVEEQTTKQICEMLLREDVEAYQKEAPKFMQFLVAKQKAKGQRCMIRPHEALVLRDRTAPTTAPVI